MSYRLSFFPFIALTATLMLGQPVRAQETPNLATVIATVDGTDITLGHIIAVRSNLPAEYDQAPANLLFTGILDQLIQQTLLVQDHKGDLPNRVRLTLENERRSVIANEVIGSALESATDAAALQAAYEAKYTNANQETEYHAAHILVETEEAATALIGQLNDGADFAALAKEHSTGPSGASGGDLGWFGAGTMVEPFFDAVTDLEAGQVSSAVQTQFGWHVIKLNETRISERPAFDDVRDELLQGLQKRAFDDYVTKLETAADITRVDISDMEMEIVNNFDLLGD